ncbi:MAG: ATP-binding cassette domain-containing protein, partial [Nanoarchaeota archaeon]
LIKLLLGFYEPNAGEIKVNNNISIKNFNHHLWRDMCGAVMQEGFIFSDSIINNIAVGDEAPNIDKIIEAVSVANIKDYIESLPLGYDTIIGQEGHGLSQGQKQRILIARAAYKNPHYLFLDEATNALDAHNERLIMENLNHFFKGRTVVIVAHRLSTVKNADQIIVLDNGKIKETGTHRSLTSQKGLYFTLVKNQLELGN